MDQLTKLMQLVGGGQNLEEVMCTIGIPSISKPTLIEKLLGSAFEDCLNEQMLQAGREERELGIQKNQYHHDVPSINVIVDRGCLRGPVGVLTMQSSVVGVIVGAATKSFCT